MNLTVREVLERYGPTMAVIATLALLVVLLPGSPDAEVSAVQPSATLGAPEPGSELQQPIAAAPSSPVPTVPTGPGGTVGTAPSTAIGTGGLAAPAPGTAAPATTAAPVTPTGSGPVWDGFTTPGQFPAPTADTSCRPDGFLQGLHRTTPPCVPVFDGDNGGATARGVTADSIRIVRYVAPPDPATNATLAAIGADDPPEVQERTDAALWRYFAVHWETYGRETEIVLYNAADDSEEAQRAAAVEIAEQLQPFAVWGAPTVAAEELAARGIICGCTTSQGRSFYEQWAPYVWARFPALEEYYAHIAEYVGKRLNGRPADHAGTNLRVSNDVRKFGLIYNEGANGRIDPRAKEGKEFFERELAKYGAKLERAVGYEFDIQQQQQQSTNIIGQMVNAGVNNVICMCDPLYPIFLTSEATRQNWFPEWFVTGTFLIDTTFFGRTYDKAQWENAFGISPLWVFYSGVENSSGYRAVHHMIPELEPGEEGAQVNPRQYFIELLSYGLHFAGPNLTVENFARGMYARPPTGGTPKEPLIFFTPESPTSIKDFTEVWWNSTGTGKDELSKDGTGIMMKANGGARYRLGQWPSSDATVFGNDPNPIFTSDDPPETLPHGVDGHTHTLETPCRSCAGPTEGH